MKRIGILGANGQVASEVAIYLSQFDDIEVVCFLRNKYSVILFEKIGIKYCIIDYYKADLFKNEIYSCDVVCDFAYPSGRLEDIYSKSKIYQDNIMRHMQNKGIYIYMSSIMAYGMADEEEPLKEYRMARGSYAVTKRKIEKSVKKNGHKYGLQCYNFRLGQVHGFLQSVTNYYREIFDGNDIVYKKSMNLPTSVVFTSTIGDAIKSIIENKNQLPFKTYTIVLNPQWTMNDVVNYYSEKYKVLPKINCVDDDLKNTPSINIFKSLLTKYLLKSRKSIEPLLDRIIPSLFPLLKSNYRIRVIKQQIREKISDTSVNLMQMTGEVPSSHLLPMKSETNQIMQKQLWIEKRILSVLNFHEK